MLREFIAYSCELRRSRGLAPVGWQIPDFNSRPGYTVGNFCYGQDEITGRIVPIKMNEILQHGEGLMFGRIAQASSGTRPASSVTVRAFTVKGRAGVRLAQHPVNAGQLIPPYAMRPRMFSTWRAPNSVSSAVMGARPPKARLGRLSQRRARPCSPRYSLAIATMRARR